MTLNYESPNRNEREVYCPKCHIYSRRTDDAPRCPNCNSILVRVCRSILTNRRLTGALRDSINSE